MFSSVRRVAVGPIAEGPGIVQLKALGARVSVLEVDGDRVLVDTGIRGSGPVIAAGMGSAQRAMEDISLLVVTHYHPDHSGALAAVSRRAGAPVAAHVSESGILDGTDPTPNPYSNRLLAAVANPFTRRLNGGSVQISHRLEDGQALPIGTGVRVIHTPGHTSGSISLLSEEHGWLVVGDAMQHRFGKLSGPAAAVTVDREAARNSLKKILEFDFDSIWFSHFPPIRQGAKQRLERLVDSFESRGQ